MDRTSQPEVPRTRRSSDPERLSIATPPALVAAFRGASSQGNDVESSPCQQSPPPPEPHSCSSDTCSLAKVFETTELLELILGLLGTQDVLRLRGTSRRWNSTVISSPLLRLHFFTYPQWQRPASEYQLLPLTLPGLMIEAGDMIHLGQWISFTLTSEAARRICPEPKQRVRARSIYEGLRGGLGRTSNDTWPASSSTKGHDGKSSYEELQIMQPPMLGMQAYVVDAPSLTDPTPTEPTSLNLDDLDLNESPSSAACAKISCDAGITLGFLADTAQTLLAPQPSGPSQTTEKAVLFKAIVSFCQSESSAKRRGGRSVRSVTRIG